MDAPAKLHLVFYPELARLDGVSIDANDPFDILLLGGSVVALEFNNIGKQIEERLTYQWGRRVRVHCLAKLGHSTLDSLHKYRRVRNRPFDLVLVYHGINETRINNCPPEMFREDYSHFARYRLINDLEASSARFSVLPYTARSALTLLLMRTGILPTMSDGFPEKWLEHGAEVKTALTFRRNLEEICRLAADAGQPVVLMTFATWVPEDYSRDRFGQRLLDYSLHDLSIELWGTVSNVLAGIEAHNAIVRELAESYGHVHLIDQAGSMPKGGLWFNDVCHFTYQGSVRFVTNVVHELKRADTDLETKNPF